ncbi:hypothetical protein FPQ18DRAFT_316009 [Pyronema domesticum]|nr:hypothetical protein FPQ18DRAFT_316009 [Pyronema domesticum]
MSDTPVVSHGRGGQGNIGPDSTAYVDGEIHRQADPTASGASYSSGRGGAGNISNNGSGNGGGATATATGTDGDIIPSEAVVPAREEGEVVHTGRGGEGNTITSEGEKVKKRPISERLKKRLSAMMAKFK